MKNFKRAQGAINKHYNERARKARRAEFRLDSRGLRVAMTPAAAVYNTAHNVERTEASASGCGYEKESAAVQKALTGSLSLARFLIENWRKVCKLYGVEMWRGFPTLDISGKGINTLREIFKKVPGWEWRGNWGRDWNGYSATRKGGRA